MSDAHWKNTKGSWSIWSNTGVSGSIDSYMKTDIRAGAHLIRICQSVGGRSFPELCANVRLMVNAPSMRDALWCIANMQITTETDTSEVLALCMSIARIELEKFSAEGDQEPGNNV